MYLFQITGKEALVVLFLFLLYALEFLPKSLWHTRTAFAEHYDKSSLCTKLSDTYSTKSGGLLLIHYIVQIVNGYVLIIYIEHWFL